MSLYSNSFAYLMGFFYKNAAKWLWSACCLTTLQPITAFALDAEAFKNLDVSIAAGPSWYHAGTSYVKPTQIETDTNVVSDVSASTSYRLGVGYHLFAEQLADRTFLNDLLVQINYYHGAGTVNGIVWGSGNPNVQNQSFEAPFTVTQFMLDLKPSLFTYMHTSVYPIVGAGLAWNRLSYSQADINDSDWRTIDAKEATTRTVVYDLGVGLSSQITSHLATTLEYLSTDLGNMTPSSVSTGQQPMVSAPTIPVRSKSLQLGLNWRF